MWERDCGHLTASFRSIESAFAATLYATHVLGFIFFTAFWSSLGGVPQSDSSVFGGFDVEEENDFFMLLKWN